MYLESELISLDCSPCEKVKRMAYVDWNKVAEDYKNSSFIWEYLNDYARKAAGILVSNGVSFDGYTDDGTPSESPRGLFGKLRHTLFGLPEDCMKLEYLHIGYWKLETCQSETHHGRRYIERSIDKRGYYREKKTDTFSGTGINIEKIWGLLADGRLAVFEIEKRYNEFNSGRCFLSNLRDREFHYFSLETKQDKQINKCRIMTEEDILLLDHKKREINCRNIGHDDYYCLEGTWISNDNYLMTGKKGNGCKKKIAALLKGHGL